MKLSILICSLESRSLELNRLLLELNKQEAKFPGTTEIITSVDNGEMAIGAKRNKLLGLATGDYICFIDDDDMVDSDYLELILDAIKTEPDCVGINLIYTVNGENPEIAEHSLKYKEWITRKEGTKNFYERTPNHLNPVKKELALQVRFPEKDFGEDHEYSNELRHILNSEVMVEKPIYHYLCKGEVKIISFGAPDENSIMLVRQVLPGWTCRFYSPTGVDHELIRKLKEEGAEVLVKDVKEDKSEFWKHEVIWDSKVTRFVIANQGPIEEELIKRWEKTEKELISTQFFWGGVKGCIPGFKEKYLEWDKNEELSLFITGQINPLINQDMVLKL